MLTSIYLKPSGRRYYISFFLAFALLSIILFLASPMLKFNVYQLIFALLVLNFFASGIAFLYFQHHYIHVEDEIITVKEGLLMSKMVVIPFDKINEIKTEYSMSDRILGVGTIMLDTAGTGAVEVIFPDVPRESINAFIALFRQYKEKKEAPGEEAKEEKPEGERDSW